MKTNFKKIKSDKYSDEVKKEFKRELTPEEFEEYVINSGARGSFMIYRSKNKDDELGLVELWICLINNKKSFHFKYGLKRLNLMNDKTRIDSSLRTVEWKNNKVVMINHTKLPNELVFVEYDDFHQVADAIKTLVVRGTPAIAGQPDTSNVEFKK